MVVSIHATLAGGDVTTYLGVITRPSFYPRHPRGWRLAEDKGRLEEIKFLSTPPSRVATF